MSEQLPEGTIPRRVVTGHDENGVSVVLSDGPVPVHKVMPQDGVGFYEIWQTEGAPAVLLPEEPSEPTQRTLRVPPPALGTKIRINEFFPGHINELGNQSPVHRTESIDYGIVLEGEIVLVLDDSEVTLRAGDVVVQRGTDHAWANRSDSVARVAFILIDAEFGRELLDLLPDIHAGIMHGGPHD
ncbi:cupin domain [Homoserinimonas aerilata]|uniref:Cupin domain n=1 Tax=Homoserinimonas aerilata TaxID=1162970 RepID=A0A542YKE4_9MICO|nr:cupin domain-containing protein [Homoserinimonas aerilata]TQL48404.1 cupin domain [Homoserinimonas aerilata]